MDGFKIKLANWIAYRMCKVREKWEIENEYWVNDKHEVWLDYSAMYEDLMTHDRDVLLGMFTRCNDDSFVDWLVNLYFKGRLSSWTKSQN